MTSHFYHRTLLLHLFFLFPHKISMKDQINDNIANNHLEKAYKIVNHFFPEVKRNTYQQL